MGNNEIKILQQPILDYSSLEEIGKEVDSRVAPYITGELVITEETKVEIKKVRAGLNAELKDFEDKRKEIKKMVLKPYEDFDKCYVSNIKSKYETASTKLKTAIDEIESKQKSEKRKDIEYYFNELCKEHELDFVYLANTGINITLSASLTSLKKQVKEFVDRVVADLETVATQPHKERVLVRYKANLNLAQSIKSVADEIAQEERIRVAEAERVSKEEIETEPIEVIKPLQAPKKVEESFTVQFKATGTRKQLLELKNFMNERGIKYE